MSLDIYKDFWILNAVFKERSNLNSINQLKYYLKSSRNFRMWNIYSYFYMSSLLKFLNLQTFWLCPGLHGNITDSLNSLTLLDHCTYSQLDWALVMSFLCKYLKGCLHDLILRRNLRSTGGSGRAVTIIIDQSYCFWKIPPSTQLKIEWSSPLKVSGELLWQFMSNYALKLPCSIEQRRSINHWADCH